MSKVLAQDAYELVLSDLHGGSLPGALLFSGKEFSGKLTAALDVADAMFGGRSFWQGSPDFLLLGHRDCCLEIAAFARRLESSPGGESLSLFLDSVRKLSLRFSQVLWDGDDSAKKFAQVLEELDGDVGALKSQSDPEKIGKLCASILKSCEKLEGDFLYESVPIDQIRNMASWAHDRPNFTKKVVVIENAELMLESARNSLLKILEEPPRDVLFILTTSNRGAVMQTILSRVRTYQFTERAASVDSVVGVRRRGDDGHRRLRTLVPARRAFRGQGNRVAVLRGSLRGADSVGVVRRRLVREIQAAFSFQHVPQGDNGFVREFRPLSAPFRGRVRERALRQGVLECGVCLQPVSARGDRAPHEGTVVRAAHNEAL